MSILDITVGDFIQKIKSENYTVTEAVMRTIIESERQDLEEMLGWMLQSKNTIHSEDIQSVCRALDALEVLYDYYGVPQ